MSGFTRAARKGSRTRRITGPGPGDAGPAAGSLKASNTDSKFAYPMRQPTADNHHGVVLGAQLTF